MDIDRIQEIRIQTGSFNSASVEEALCKVWDECTQENEWKPIATAPRDGTFVMLLMDSGYLSTPYGIIIARFVPNYQPDGRYDHRWRDHANDSVHDGFGEIIAWKEWKVPDITFRPDEGIYDYLKPGDKIIEGDEFERGKDIWVELTNREIKSWSDVTGKQLTVSKDSVRVRRKCNV